jgi:hypothetical protein
LIPALKARNWIHSPSFARRTTVSGISHLQCSNQLRAGFPGAMPQAVTFRAVGAVKPKSEPPA